MPTEMPDMTNHVMPQIAGQKPKSLVKATVAASATKKHQQQKEKEESKLLSSD